MSKPKILLIGSVPPPVGGVAVSFKLLVDILKQNDEIEIRVLDIAQLRRSSGNSFSFVFKFAARLWRQIGQCDVATLYCATTSIWTVGLMTLVQSKVRGKPFLLRKAASKDYEHEDFGFLKSRINAWVVRHADLFLAQTKSLVETTRSRGIKHVQWYPTTRPSWSGVAEESDHDQFRFVFIGHVRESKGIRELIAASNHVSSLATVDIYGPLFDGLTKENIESGNLRVQYLGALSPENVQPTMAKYDAMILPTKAMSEGYPGAILEAFNVGLPIITTNIGGIPELVDPTCAIVVPPGDIHSLANAMQQLAESKEIAAKLRRGSRGQSELFNAEMWANRFVGFCRSLIERRKMQKADLK